MNAQGMKFYHPNDYTGRYNGSNNNGTEKFGGSNNNGTEKFGGSNNNGTEKFGYAVYSQEQATKNIAKGVLDKGILS